MKKILTFGFIVLLAALVGCKKKAAPEAVSPLDAPPAVVVSQSSLPTPAAADTTQMRIMFRSNREGEARWYSMNPDGSDVQRMNFSEAAHATALIWIPELNAFSAMLNLDNQDNLFLLDAQGNELRRLTSTPAYKGLPTYSSATGLFAFPCVQSDLDICTVSSQGGEILNLTNYPSREDGPIWSPSGEQILFVSNRDAVPDVWIVNRDGSGLQNLTMTGQPHGDPQWSPDGKQILFTSQRDFNWEVYVMDASGQNPVNLTNHPEKDVEPLWSPDGEYIVFHSNRTGDEEIYVIKADGAELVNVTNLSQSDEYVYKWSPDGTKIMYVSKADGDTDVYIVNRDGTEAKNLTNSSYDDFAPKWIYH